MNYSGFSEAELTRIIEILESYQIPFEVSADEQGIQNAKAIIASEAYSAARGKHGALVDNSFYSISFDRNGLKNLSVSEFRELKKLRIFP